MIDVMELMYDFITTYHESMNVKSYRFIKRKKLKKKLDSIIKAIYDMNILDLIKGSINLLKAMNTFMPINLDKSYDDCHIVCIEEDICIFMNLDFKVFYYIKSNRLKVIVSTENEKNEKLYMYEINSENVNNVPNILGHSWMDKRKLIIDSIIDVYKMYAKKYME